MRLALCILVALQVLDVATTVYAIDSGAGREANPYAAWLIAAGGYQAVVAAKAVAVTYVTGLYVFMPERGRPALDFVIRAAAVAYVYVVFSNLRVGGLV